MANEEFLDTPPTEEALTVYDHEKLKLYMRLLDSVSDGADWREAVRTLFSINPDEEPVRARSVYDSHLARARWMTQSGYRHLLRQSLN